MVLAYVFHHEQCRTPLAHVRRRARGGACARGEFGVVHDSTVAMLSWKLKWPLSGDRFDVQINMCSGACFHHGQCRPPHARRRARAVHSRKSRHVGLGTAACLRAGARRCPEQQEKLQTRICGVSEARAASPSGARHARHRPCTSARPRSGRARDGQEALVFAVHSANCATVLPSGWCVCKGLRVSTTSGSRWVDLRARQWSTTKWCSCVKNKSKCSWALAYSS